MKRSLWAVLLSASAVGCGALAGGTISNPVVNPRPVAFITCVPGATVSVSGYLIADNLAPRVTDASGNTTFGSIPGAAAAVNIVITKDGYPPFQMGAVALPPGAHQFVVGACVPITDPVLQIQLPAWIPNRPFPAERGRLRVADRHFVTEDGAAWSWRGSSMFLLGARYFTGQDITPQLAWMQAAGVNVARVFDRVTWDNLADYGVTNPGETDPGKLAAFFDLLASHGLRVEYVPLTYADDLGAMRARVQRAYDAAAGRWNVLIEVANEPENNQINVPLVMQGIDRHGVLSASGMDPGRHCAELDAQPDAWTACEQRELFVLDYLTPHDLARDPQHSPRNTKDFTIDFGFFGVPMVADEHVGLIDLGYPRYCYGGDGFASLCSGGGVRTTDCTVLLSAAAIEHLFGPGFTLHFQSGLEGRAPRADEPIQSACAAQFTKLWAFLPADAQLGQYRAPHLGDFPFVWTDADSRVGHAYCSVQGGTGWCVNPMPRDGWPGFAGLNGWRVDAIGPFPFLAKVAR